MTPNQRVKPAELRRAMTDPYADTGDTRRMVRRRETRRMVRDGATIPVQKGQSR